MDVKNDLRFQSKAKQDYIAILLLRLIVSTKNRKLNMCFYFDIALSLFYPSNCLSILWEIKVCLIHFSAKSIRVGLSAANFTSDGLSFSSHQSSQPIVKDWKNLQTSYLFCKHRGRTWKWFFYFEKEVKSLKNKKLNIDLLKFSHWQFWTFVWFS